MSEKENISEIEGHSDKTASMAMRNLRGKRAQSVLNLQKTDDFHAIRNGLVGTQNSYYLPTIIKVNHVSPDNSIIKCPRCNTWRDRADYFDKTGNERYICRNCRIAGNTHL